MAVEKRDQVYSTVNEAVANLGISKNQLAECADNLNLVEGHLDSYHEEHHAD